jgi:hypothetical protein
MGAMNVAIEPRICVDLKEPLVGVHPSSASGSFGFG